MAEIIEIHQKKNQEKSLIFLLRNSDFINEIAIDCMKLYRSHSVLKLPDKFTAMPRILLVENQLLKHIIHCEKKFTNTSELPTGMNRFTKF